MEQFLASDLPASLLAPNSCKLFRRLKIDPEFLLVEPEEWEKDNGYLAANEKVNAIKVVNDTAERAVQLIDDFSHMATKNEHQKQYAL